MKIFIKKKLEIKKQLLDSHHNFNSTQSGGGLKYIEYKSYGTPSSIPKNQFLEYMSKINQISELNYVFNAAKASESAARNGVKNFILNSNNTQDIFNAMTTELRKSLQIDDVSDITPAFVDQMVNIFVTAF